MEGAGHKLSYPASDTSCHSSDPLHKMRLLLQKRHDYLGITGCILPGRGSSLTERNTCLVPWAWSKAGTVVLLNGHWVRLLSTYFCFYTQSNAALDMIASLCRGWRMRYRLHNLSEYWEYVISKFSAPGVHFTSKMQGNRGRGSRKIIGAGWRESLETRSSRYDAAIATTIALQLWRRCTRPAPKIREKKKA